MHRVMLLSSNNALTSIVYHQGKKEMELFRYSLQYTRLQDCCTHHGELEPRVCHAYGTPCTRTRFHWKQTVIMNILTSWQVIYHKTAINQSSRTGARTYSCDSPFSLDMSYNPGHAFGGCVHLMTSYMGHNPGGVIGHFQGMLFLVEVNRSGLVHGDPFMVGT